LRLVIAALLAVAGPFGLVRAALADDPGRVDAYVTPYYDSSGPVIRIGKYSAGLASKNPKTLVATVQAMKKEWTGLSFVKLYVAAIRLYDAGYRNEATYWFYTAQYQGRLFAALADQKKLGSIGSPGFELYHAQNAFFQLAGPNINGYAFGDPDTTAAIVRRVQNENQTVANLQAIYPDVTFIGKAQWNAKNADINSGLGELAATIVAQRSEMKQQRVANGTEARFAHLTSTQFPGGY
jgi:hypothetical protein